MAEYVNDLPEAEHEPQPTDRGLAGDMKDAHLVAENKPAQEVTRHRPFGVVAAMVLMVMGAAWVMPFIFLLASNNLTDIPPLWVGLGIAMTTGLGIVASMAMWMMKRWSVPAYTAVVIANNLIIMLLGHWNIFHLAIPLIILAVAYSQLRHLE
jgi:hypothetical protein